MKHINETKVIAGGKVDINEDFEPKDPMSGLPLEIRAIHSQFDNGQIEAGAAFEQIAEIIEKQILIREKHAWAVREANRVEPSCAIQGTGTRMPPSAKMVYETKHLKLVYESSLKGPIGKLYARHDPEKEFDAEWFLVDDAFTSFSFSYDVNSDTIPQVKFGFKAY